MRKTLFMNTKPTNSRADIQASSEFSLSDLMRAIKDAEEGIRPVESWDPKLCGDIDIVIKADGSWWHEGARIGRSGLIGLFASVLRKDADGETYLVTPAEKLRITVERAHFVATRLDVQGEGKEARLFFTTDFGGTVEASADNPIRVETDAKTLEPSPFILVRGRLDASLARPVFYELVDCAVEIQTQDGPQLGVYSNNVFFPLGPPRAHLDGAPQN